MINYLDFAGELEELGTLRRILGSTIISLSTTIELTFSKVCCSFSMETVTTVKVTRAKCTHLAGSHVWRHR